MIFRTVKLIMSNRAMSVNCGKGFLDKTPLFMTERQAFIDNIEKVYKLHGVDRLETPVFELKEIFSKLKNKLPNVIDLNDQGGEILAMRYDLKCPLMRYLTMNKIENPVKISQFGYIYRNEFNTEKLRFKEFFVSDFDICGPSDVMVSEAQCIRVAFDVINSLNIIENILVRVSHRKLTELLLRISTKIDANLATKLVNKMADTGCSSSINWSVVHSLRDEKLTDAGLIEFQKMCEKFSGPPEFVLNLLKNDETLTEMKESKSLIDGIQQFLELSKCQLSEADFCRLYIDSAVVGPRDYYTGLVFVAKFESEVIKSVTDFVILSGGRYEKLATRLNSKYQNSPACTGFSVGIDRLVFHTLLKKNTFRANYPLLDSSDYDKLSSELGKISTKSSEKKELFNKASDQLKNPKGACDRRPDQMIVREHVFSIIRQCFMRHNAGTIDTPVIELHDILTNKYGDDSKLIYDLNDIDGEKLSLRYDLTVPFARYIAMRPEVVSDLAKPFKRCQIGKVYRRDNPSMSRGRYREFYQCDFDIAGGSAKDRSTTLQMDAECLSIVYEILQDLELGEYTIKVNHRKLLDGVFAVCGVPEDLFRTVCSSVDKLDKTEWDSVYKEMIEKGVDESVANLIGKYVVNKKGGIDLVNELKLDVKLRENSSVVEALDDLGELFRYCDGKMDKISFDLSLARGLDYYTGIIFEAVITGFESGTEAGDSETSVGSVSGGGRYDNLVNMFSSAEVSIPCVGLSMGVERLMAIYERKLSLENERKKPFVMVMNAQRNMVNERLRLLSFLIDNGIPAVHVMKRNPNALDVFQECEKSKIPYALIVGEDELKVDSVKLRCIASRKEELVRRSELIDRMKFELGL